MPFWRRKKTIEALPVGHDPHAGTQMDGTYDQGFAPVEAQGYVRDDEPRMSDLTVGDYANGMPNIRLGQMFASLMKQLVWVVPLFLIGAAVAWQGTKDFKRTYSGDGRIMVQIGDEYIYQSVSGNAGAAGLMQTPDTITLNEVAIMKNAEVIDQVIGESLSGPYGALFAPEITKKIQAATQRGDERARQDEWMKLRKMVDRDYLVMPRPKSSIIDIVYKHENPEVAVETLNRFIDAYLAYRRTIFVDGAGDVISERRAATEQQLNQNERAISRFLSKNNVSDFESEQGGARKRTEELKAALNGLRAQISETESALMVVEDQLRGTNQQIDLYVDDRASQRVAQAELELKQLLAKYLPTSNPVRQKQTELNELKSLQTSYGGRAAGGRRVGPNPVYQALLTRRNTLSASADSFREKEITLQRQLNGADAKVRRLMTLSPEYQNLLRERDTLSVRLKTYNAKEQEALINQQQAQANAENVRVISRATYPSKGRDMRKVMFALATLGWGLVLFMLALMRVFLDPKLYAKPAPARSARAAIVPTPEVESAIPEAVPAYAPQTPMADPNPYVPQDPVPYAPAAAHMPAEYVAQPHAQTAYASDPYAAQGYDAYGNPVQPYAAPNPYAAQAYAPDQGGQQPAYDLGATEFTPYTDGNAALDLSYNPYASGQVKAGAIDDQMPPPTTQG